MCRDALSSEGLTSHTRAILLGQLGALAAHGGRLDDADRWLSHAIENLADDPVAVARLRMNRSLVRLPRLRLGDAMADLQAAAGIFSEQGLKTEEAQARHNLGYTSLLAGDVVSALQEMLAARPLAASSAVAQAVGDVDRAEVLRDAGLTTEAEQILAKTATVFGSHRMPQSRAEAEFNLARSLLTHDASSARRVAKSATRRFRSLGNDAWAARSDAVRMRAEFSAGTMDRSGEPMTVPSRTPAPESVLALASELDEHRFTTDAAALRMSQELWRSRHGARDAGTTVIIRPPASASMEVRLLAHTVRAERAASRGRDAEARRHAARGLDTLAAWQRDFGSLDLQTSIAMHGSDLVFAGLTSAARSGRPDVIFEWSERARHLSLQVVPLRPPPDVSVADQLAELRMLRAEHGANWLADPRAAELHERARERQWSATGSSAFEDRSTLDDLQIALDDDAALISYVFSRDGLVALVVTPGGATVVPLDRFAEVRRAMPGLRADLDMAASVRIGPIADVVRRSLEARLATLSAALLDVPADAAGARRLVITAPGVLNGIPWAMLPGMQGRAFTVAASASRWVNQRPGVGGDASTSSATGAGAGVARAGFVVGPRVARGDEEVDRADAAWERPQTVRNATVDDVAELATEVDILHIAAHGRHAVDNPMFSGLELADGALFGYDIDRISPVPDTVVLSACEAGRSSVRWGEEAVGMTRIWMHAGTRCVIAAPVIVADDDACELLAAMHVGLAAGQPPAEALAEASRTTGIVAPFQAHGSGF